MTDHAHLEAHAVGGAAAGATIIIARDQYTASFADIGARYIDEYIYRRVDIVVDDPELPLVLLVPADVPQDEMASYAIDQLVTGYKASTAPKGRKRRSG